MKVSFSKELDWTGGQSSVLVMADDPHHQENSNNLTALDCISLYGSVNVCIIKKSSLLIKALQWYFWDQHHDYFILKPLSNLRALSRCPVWVTPVCHFFPFGRFENSSKLCISKKTDDPCGHVTRWFVWGSFGACFQLRGCFAVITGYDVIKTPPFPKPKLKFVEYICWDIEVTLEPTTGRSTVNEMYMTGFNFGHIYTHICVYSQQYDVPNTSVYLQKVNRFEPKYKHLGPFTLK